MPYDDHRDCGTETDFAVITPDLRSDVRALQDWFNLPAPIDVRTLAARIRAIVADVDTAPEIVAECPFSGPVEVHPLPGGASSWTCPICQTDHIDTPD